MKRFESAVGMFCEAPERIVCNRWAILTVILIAAALRVMFASIVEFTSDEENSMPLGAQTRAANFLVAYERLNSRGIYDPPGFAWVMGAATAFSEDPWVSSAIFAGLNILALFYAASLFRRSLPGPMAFFSIMFMAVNPGYILNASKLWELSIAPLFALLFIKKTHDYVEKEKPGDFIWAAVMAGLVAQIHMAGFFLFIVLACVGVIRRGGVTLSSLGKAALALAVLFSPYIYYMLWQGGLASSMKTLERGPEGYSLWRILRMSAAISSMDFMRYYFADFYAALEKSMGRWGRIEYEIALGLSYCMTAGVLAYGAWAARARTFFSVRGPFAEAYPPMAQVSSFVLIAGTLMFIGLKIVTFPFYMTLFFPAQAVISAWPFWAAWSVKRARPFVLTAALGLAGLNFWMILGFYSMFSHSGGHNDFYGVSLAKLSEIRKAVREMTPPGMAPEVRPFIYHNDEGSQNQPPRVFKSYIEKEYSPSGSKPKYPMDLFVVWDSVRWKYQWAAKPANPEMDRMKEQSFKAGAEAMPQSARIQADPYFSAYLPDRAMGGYLDLRNGLAAIGPEAEYIAVYAGDGADPVRGPQQKTVYQLAVSPGWGVVYYENGVLAAKRGGAKGPMDRKLFADFFHHVDIYQAGRETGGPTQALDSLTGFALEARKGKSRNGFMACCNYMDLKPGRYTAHFRLRARNADPSAMVKLQVSGNAGKFIIIEKELGWKELGGMADWAEYDLPFVIEGETVTGVETRIHFGGGADVMLDRMGVEPAGDLLEQYLAQ